MRWVDLKVSSQVLEAAYKLDTKTKGTDNEMKFVEILAALTAKNGNNFNVKRDMKNLDELKNKVEKGQTIAAVYAENKWFKHYVYVYSAVFEGYLGDFVTENGESGYGLLAYHPVAKGHWYTSSDDFGNSRSYGFKRVHLGHDLFGSVGAPIIAVEGGTITEFGWNRFGGWRVGIRSDDGLRYYYYAHLRKDKPFADGLEKGGRVEAGQVVGYLGRTGYSFKENVNMNTRAHLHFGMQLIFDKSQEDGAGEIWIDVCQIVRFLQKNRAAVEKIGEGQWKSVNLRRAD